MQPQRFEYSDENCSIRRSLEIVGERWSLLVLREAFYGVRRFDDFIQAIGCPRDALTARLRTLVAEGVLERVPYQAPGSRRRHEYQLTEKGRDLFPALMALLAWGDRWTADPAGPAVCVTHRDCGAPLRLSLGCEAGHEITLPEVQAAPGPGARRVAA